MVENTVVPADCPKKGPCGRCKVCRFPRTEVTAILGIEKSYYETEARWTGEREQGIGIAVDIGTTTLVMAAIDLASGKCMLERKATNPQRIYGADVISRIGACMEYGVEALQKPVLEEVAQIIVQVLSAGQKIHAMMVCGNSIMEYIFLGKDPACLGEYPYACRFTETQTVSAQVLFGSGEFLTGADFPVTVFPNVSAFVGGDVVAGVISGDMDRLDGRLLMDLGTNGEIALSHQGVIYTTSTAAGPALEGGNMTYGVAGIPGAICGIRLEEDEVHCETIKDAPAVGICGSGYIQGISELLAHGWIDETGYLAEPMEMAEGIYITPADVRNLQMAKSAVRSGLHALCRHAGINFSQIREVILAGGFGHSADRAAFVNVGLLPGELVARTRSAGNTALDGVIRTLLSGDTERLTRISKGCVHVNLAEDEDFTKEYMKHMEFAENG